MLLQKSVEFLEYAKGQRGHSLTKLAKEFGAPVFKFVADSEIQPDPVASAVSADGAPRVRLVASTTMTDLAADVMTPNAEKRMLEAAVGTTMFMNHRFDVPMDVFATVEKATIEERELTDTFTGAKVKALCLVYIARVCTSNPLAMQCYNTIAEGIRLGASVTVLVLDLDMTKDGRQLINDVYYLECSIVGLPMNQYSWVEYAGKALKALENTATKIKEAVAISSKSKGFRSRMARKYTKRGKSWMEQSLAEEDMPSNVWDLCWALIDLLRDVVENTEDGQITDPQAMLTEIMAEFSAMVIERVTPALAHISDKEGEGQQAGYFTGYSASSASRLLDLPNANQKLLPAMAVALMKGGARHSKEDQATIKGIHDASATLLSYKCAKDMEAGVKDEEDKKPSETETETKALSDQLALLKKDNATLSQRLESAQTEKEQWKASASVALAKLKAFSREPLERPTRNT
ncbi:MAG: hypothetical protein HXX20_02200 [Chloroflexi bacterium]|nr:hypothetical protein [Chloroflexota bacterium]